MSAITTTLDIKSFGLLIKGLTHILYYANNQSNNKNNTTAATMTTTREELSIKLYTNSGLDTNEIKNEMELFENILRRAGYENWTQEQLKEFLITNQFADEYIQIFVNYWHKESTKINQILAEKVTFNNIVDDISWRVDIEAMNNSTKDMNESGKAYFELQFHQGSNQQSKSVAKFEMDRVEVANMYTALTQIENALAVLGAD